MGKLRLRGRLSPALVHLLWLCAATSAPAAVPPPPVYFSHVYVVLDKDTYEAVRGSPEIAALAGGGELQTEANSQAWTSFYLKGRQTYIEFFSDRAPQGLKVGDGGIGLTVEQPGALRAVERSWLDGFGQRVVLAPSARTLGSRLVPWASTLSLRGMDPAVAPSVMELDPDFVAAEHPRQEIGNPLSREAYMASEWEPDLLLDNVVGVQVALEKPRLLELSKALIYSGWELKKDKDGFLATGPDMRISAIPAAPGHEGVRRIDLTLQRAAPSQTTPLEKARLILGGKQGRIELEPMR